MRGFLIALAALFICGFAAASYAQSAPDTLEPAENVLPEPESDRAGPVIDYADLPDAYIIRADDFHQYCNTTLQMNRYYNCECLAVAFLDTLVESGLERSRPSIMMEIRDQCRDAAGMAGFLYAQCLNNSVMLPADLDEDLYCGCFGNTVAALYEKGLYAVGSQSEVNAKASAHNSCRNPNFAEKMYAPPVEDSAEEADAEPKALLEESKTLPE